MKNQNRFDAAIKYALGAFSDLQQNLRNMASRRVDPKAYSRQRTAHSVMGTDRNDKIRGNKLAESMRQHNFGMGIHARNPRGTAGAYPAPMLMGAKHKTARKRFDANSAGPAITLARGPRNRTLRRAAERQHA